ncbi:MAG: hypothetical protein ABJB55_05925 [Actinomycetota bacterium]
MAARFLWGGLTLAFLLGLFLTRSSQNSALNTEIQHAQSRAATYANTTIAQAATVDSGSGGITFVPKEFTVQLQAGVFTDPTVARVRVWDARGTLQASSDPTEDVGGLVAADPKLAGAVQGTTSAQTTQEPFTFSTIGAPAASAKLLQVFVPLHAENQVQPVGAVQVDFLYGSLAAAASSPWSSLSRTFLILAVLSAALFALSILRKPITASDRAAMATAPVAAVTVPVPDESAVARDDALEDELQAAREQLRQATEAFAFLETRMKDGSGSQAPSPDVEAASARIAELETALNRAEAEAALARSSAVTQDDLDRVRHEADERVAELERRMDESSSADLSVSDAQAAAEAKAQEEAAALRAKLADAEVRAAHAEAALVAARDQATLPVESPKQVAPSRAPESSEPSDPDDLIAELEAQVAAAEVRAKEAEDEALHLSPEANDLRARLARNAARKRFGPTG